MIFKYKGQTLSGAPTGSVIEFSLAEYNALSQEEKDMEVFYVINDQTSPSLYEYSVGPGLELSDSPGGGQRLI